MDLGGPDDLFFLSAFDRLIPFKNNNMFGESAERQRRIYPLCAFGAPRGVRKYINTFKDERTLQPNLPFWLKYT